MHTGLGRWIRLPGREGPAAICEDGHADADEEGGAGQCCEYVDLPFTAGVWRDAGGRPGWPRSQGVTAGQVGTVSALTSRSANACPGLSGGTTALDLTSINRLVTVLITIVSR